MHKFLLPWEFNRLRLKDASSFQFAVSITTKLPTSKSTNMNVSGDIEKDFISKCQEFGIRVQPICEKEKLYETRIYFLVFGYCSQSYFDDGGFHVARFQRGHFYHKFPGMNASEVNYSTLLNKYYKNGIEVHIFEYVD